MIQGWEVLEEERKKLSISLEKMADGICTQQMASKNADGKSEMDVLTFSILLERLGKDPDDLEYILTVDDYEKLESRRNIMLAFTYGRYKQAENLWNAYSQNDRADTPVMQMYAARIRTKLAMCKAKSKEELKKAKSDCLQAIRITLPGINRENYGDYLISTYEMENILMYAEIKYLLGEREQASALVKELYQYAMVYYRSEALKVRIAPKCVMLLGKYDDDSLTQAEYIYYCEEALKMMCNQGVLYMILPVITYLEQAYKRSGREIEAKEMGERRVFLEKKTKKYIPKMKQDDILFRWVSATCHLDCEMIKGECENQERVASEVMEDIYASELSVRKILKGSGSPNKTKYRKIMDSLGLNRPRRTGFVLTDSFEALEWIWEIRRALGRAEYEKALKMIDERPAENESEERIRNAYRTIALNMVGEIDTKKAIRVLRKEIDSSYPLGKEHYGRIPFQEEMDAIIAYTYLLNGIDFTEIQLIYKGLMEACEKSKLLPPFMYRVYSSIYGNYLQLLHEKFSEKEFYRRKENLIKKMMETGKGGALSGIYWARVLREWGKSPSHIEDYEGAFRYAELFVRGNVELMKESYDKALLEIMGRDGLGCSVEQIQ